MVTTQAFTNISRLCYRCTWPL